MRNLILVVMIGLGGAAVLLWLGTWQVQRLQWKTAILAQIEDRIAADPVALPADPDPEADRYLPVTLRGEIGTGLIRVLVSSKADGAGHRLIAPVTLDAGRRIMVDLGFLAQGRAMPELPTGALRMTGNLHWPQEVDGFTPDPDLDQGLWFARDVDRMAQALDTEPLLVVRRGGDPVPGVVAWPVSSAGIPNDHLEYAITWFSLAAIWLAMTGILVYRIRKPKGGSS